MKIAAFDLGTNTFRILIGELENGQLKKIYRETNITRLGEGLVKNSLISDNAIKRSISILKKYKMLSEEHGVNKVLAVGTSAFRNAVNAKEVVSYIHEEAGINIDILSGYREAELTVKGVLKSLDPSVNKFYHLDIGGGSTEISFINNGEIKYSNSIDLGVVSFAENSLFKNDSIKKISEKVSEVLIKNINYDKKNYENLPLVATSGTPIVIACILSSIKEFNPSLVSNMKISLSDVELIKERLIKHSNHSLLETFGNLLKGREDLIVPGTLLLLQTMKFLKNDCMIISDSGLLEGLSYLEH